MSVKKLLLVLFLASVSLAVAFLVYSRRHDLQFGASAEDFFQGGRAYLQAGKNPEAKIQFLNALRVDPGHREARYSLAQAYLAGEKWDLAMHELRALLEFHPDDTPASLQLGNLYLLAGQRDPEFLSEAGKIAHEVIQKDPDNAAAHILAGNAAAGLKDYSASIRSLERAVNLDPENVSLLVNLGAVRVAQGDREEAERALLSARELDPKGKNPLLSLSNFHLAAGEAEAARTVVEEALEHHPGDRDVYHFAVQVYYRLGLFEALERTLHTAQKELPEDPSPSLKLVDFLRSQNRWSEVEDLFRELRESFPDSPDISKAIAIAYLQRDPERARAEIASILAAHPQDPVGLLLRGQHHFFSGDLDQAEASMLEALEAGSSHPQPDFFLGRIAAARANGSEAENRFRKALDRAPNYAEARVGLAELYLQQGRTQDSLLEVQKVLELQPNHFQGRLLRARLDMARGGYEAAGPTLLALADERSQDARVHLQLGVYYRALRRFQAAEQHYRKALQFQPDSETTARQVVEFYISRQQPEKAVASINQLVPGDRRQAFHFELMGQAQSEAGQSQDAESSYRRAIEMQPDRVTSYVLLSGLHFRKGQTEEGLKMIDELISRNPEVAQAYALKATVQLLGGDTLQAEANFRKALDIDPRLAQAANSLAYLLAEQGKDLPVALRWAQTARKLDPNNPAYADTLGWVFYQQGSFSQARELFRLAAESLPEDPVVQYHLGMACWKTGFLEEAKDALARSLKSKQDFRERPLAEAALKAVSEAAG